MVSPVASSFFSVSPNLLYAELLDYLEFTASVSSGTSNSSSFGRAITCCFSTFHRVLHPLNEFNNFMLTGFIRYRRSKIHISKMKTILNKCSRLQYFVANELQEPSRPRLVARETSSSDYQASFLPSNFEPGFGYSWTVVSSRVCTMERPYVVLFRLFCGSIALGWVKELIVPPPELCRYINHHW